MQRTGACALYQLLQNYVHRMRGGFSVGKYGPNVQHLPTTCTIGKAAGRTKLIVVILASRILSNTLANRVVHAQPWRGSFGGTRLNSDPAMPVAASLSSTHVGTAISRFATNVKDVVTGIYTTVCAEGEAPPNVQTVSTA